MNHDRPTHRSYNEKEMRALIQRATEMHEEAMGASERSLSLEEIEHIAAELGLPPEYMQTAALELEDRLNTGKASNVFGAPFVIDQARVVPETMTQEQWEQIVMELRAFTGKKGEIDEVGLAREWTHTVGDGEGGINFAKTRVALRPGDGQTSIQIRKRYGTTATLAYVGAFFLTTLLTIVTIEAFDGMGLPDIANWTILIGMALGALAAVRGSISWWAKRQKARLKRLTHLIHQTLSTSSPQVLEIEHEPTTELIELPERDEQEPITPQARQGLRA